MFLAAVGSLFGGFLASYNINYAVYATVPFFFAMVLVALTLQEPKREKLIISDKYATDMWKVVKNIIFTSKKLYLLLVVSFCIKFKGNDTIGDMSDDDIKSFSAKIKNEQIGKILNKYLIELKRQPMVIETYNNNMKIFKKYYKLL